jgi:TIR domain
MNGAIFISYRRDDSEGEAGRLYDDLIRIFGSESVFMDVSDIHPGKDFRRAIDDNVSQCAVLLAIIGTGWINARDAEGTRRLDQPNDFVRLEIASALARDIDVIPVLVHGARMPAPADLPENLQDLAYRNGVEITHARWNSDVETFTRILRQYVERGADFPTWAIRKAITGENLAQVTSPPQAGQPARRSNLPPAFLRLLTAGLALVAAAVAGASAYVYIHSKLRHYEKENARAAEQIQDQRQNPNAAATSTSAPPPSAQTPALSTPAPQAVEAATPSTPAPQTAHTTAFAATSMSASHATPAVPSTAPSMPNPLAGAWVANQWHSAARASIPIGTPVEFMIAQHGNQFSVDMLANVGNAAPMSCGNQSVPLTSQGLSMLWNEAASPSCGKYPGMYTVNVRLYMVEDRMHMIASGKGISTGMDFDRIQ